VLEKYNVELIGAKREAIDKAEDRELFRVAMGEIGLECPTAAVAHTLDEALEIQTRVGFPTIIRPLHPGRQRRRHRLQPRRAGRDRQPRPGTVADQRVLIEESVLGWKEFEMEVVRDKADNCIIVCSIENLDPMGVHTGDSITVAPAQTLTDKEYQRLRDASIAVLRKIGVDTGGSNVQFGDQPKTAAWSSSR
jgi:carbamoyl-phosphate synthase large subunit